MIQARAAVETWSTKSGVSSSRRRGGPPPEYKSKYFEFRSTGGCKGRNELGQETLTFWECQLKCFDDTNCVSFEFRKRCPDPQNKRCCQLSTSCSYKDTVKKAHDKYDFFEKRFPKDLTDCPDEKVRFGRHTKPNSRSKCLKVKKSLYCGHGTHFNRKNTDNLEGSAKNEKFSAYYHDTTGKFCVQRTDESSGWAQDLTLGCKKRQCIVEKGKYCGEKSTELYRHQAQKCLDRVADVADCTYYSTQKIKVSREQGKVCVAWAVDEEERYQPGYAYKLTCKISCGA